MNKYIVEHPIPNAGKLTPVELKAIVEQCLLVQAGMESSIAWVQTAVTADRLVTFYEARNESAIQELSRLSGMPVQQITQVLVLLGPESSNSVAKINNETNR